VSNCLFCKIVAGEIPANVVAQDERFLAFHDINPAAPTHILVIPRTHFANAAEMAATDPVLAGQFLAFATNVAQAQAHGGYRVVFNTGPDGGQTVEHVHAHLLGGRPLHWPPG